MLKLLGLMLIALSQLLGNADLRHAVLQAVLRVGTGLTLLPITSSLPGITMGDRRASAYSLLPHSNLHAASSMCMTDQHTTPSSLSLGTQCLQLQQLWPGATRPMASTSTGASQLLPTSAPAGLITGIWLNPLTQPLHLLPAVST